MPPRLVPCVLIDPDGTFKVAKDGFNVNTATPFQLAFDARAAAMGRAITGTRKLPPRATQFAPPRITIVPFGRTFDTPPMFLLGRTEKDFPTRFVPVRNEGYDRQDTRVQREVHALVKVDRVQFSNYFEQRDGITVRWKALI